MLPHNLSAEAALIGAVLINNDVFFRIEREFRGENFYSPEHAEVADLLRTVITAGRVADPITLSETFDQSEILKAAGGSAYLFDLAEHAAIGPEVRDYAVMLAGLAARRAVMTSAERLIEMARSEADYDPDRILSDAESILGSAVVRHGGDGRWHSAESATGDAIDELMANESTPAIRTGIGPLDGRLGGLFPGELVILAGRPAMGKSAIAQNIAFNAAASDHVVGLFSQEMDKRQLAYRAASMIHHKRHGEVVPYKDFRKGLVSHATLERIRATVRHLPRVHWDATSSLTIDEIRSRMRRLKAMQGRVDLVVIDYLQIMNLPQDRNRSIARSIQDVTTALKRMAGEFECPVLLLSQLNRGVEYRNDKRPKLADLRESGAIEQDADVVLFAYREHYYASQEDADGEGAVDAMEHERRLRELEPLLELIIAKARNDATGSISCFWNAPTSLITDTQEEARAR